MKCGPFWDLMTGEMRTLWNKLPLNQRLSLLSAWSSDPTLSQAFVPWFFNCVPNDRQQADELIEEIYNKRKIARVVTIADNAYDSNQALKIFLKNVKLSGKNEPVNFLYDNYIGKLDILAKQITKSQANCIVLFCQPSVSLKIIRLMRQRQNEPACLWFLVNP